MTPEIIRAIARTVSREEIAMDFTKEELQTTDATATLILSIDTESATKGRIKYIVNALTDDGLTGATIERIFGYKNDGTTLTITSETDILIDNDFSTANVAANVNGTAIEIKVTGEASTNISWVGSYEHKKIIVEVLAP